MRRWLSPEARAVSSAAPDRSTVVAVPSGALVLLLLALSFSFSSTERVWANESMSGPFVAIEADRTAGAISDAEALLYRFFLVSDRTRVPSEYLTTAGPPIRCATQIYLEMGERVSEYPEDLQRQIQSLLVRPDPAGESVTYSMTWARSWRGRSPSSWAMPATPVWCFSCAKRG